jgi:hypothetical protein
MKEVYLPYILIFRHLGLDFQFGILATNDRLLQLPALLRNARLPSLRAFNYVYIREVLTLTIVVILPLIPFNSRSRLSCMNSQLATRNSQLASIHTSCIPFNSRLSNSAIQQFSNFLPILRQFSNSAIFAIQQFTSIQQFSQLNSLYS